MSKLAHSHEPTMQRIESDRILRDDPSAYRCCGCGLAAYEEWKPCDCPTGLGYRRIKGKLEVISLKTTNEHES